MNSAAFLLAFNGAIGLSFAVTFLALTRASEVRLGRWCAAGFVAAAATVTVEALASFIPWVRVTSALSFGLLMLALTAITAGLIRHYTPRASTGWLLAAYLAAVAVNVLIVFDLPRGSWGQALGYQSPFVLMLAVATARVLRTSPRRPVDLVLAAVLGLSAVQFLTKAVLAGHAGSGPGVRDYLVSTYAFYSQTAGGILSLLLGVALVGLVAHEVMAETALRLQRDGLSGVLNRAAFMERVPDTFRKSAGTGAILILADLDRFKSINDRFGHAAGDEVIRAFGAHLCAHFAQNALLGRLGGEEFCVLVPDCSAATAHTHLDALRSLSRQTRYTRLPPGVAVTASFGVALTEAHEPFEDALHRADMALYEAKAAGRDAYRFAPARTSDATRKDPCRTPAGAELLRDPI